MFAFVNFTSADESNPDNIGERSIFTLPDLNEFDGAVLMANTINLECEREYLKREILKYKIPAVSFEYEMDGIPYLGTDTYWGVYHLVQHVMREIYRSEKPMFLSIIRRC